jgi:hypothetical protein
MRLRWFAARAADKRPNRSDAVLAESESVRRQLLVTTDKLAAYTESLQVEIARLKKLADQVKDDNGQTR